MQRVSIDLPDSFHFSTQIPVRITDLNYGNHVGNDAFLALIHEARMQFLHHHGYREMDIEGYGLIMADAAIRFKAELLYGDLVTIRVAALHFSGSSFQLVYALEVTRNNQVITAAAAATGMVLFDYKRRRPVPVSETIKAQLQQQSNG